MPKLLVTPHFQFAILQTHLTCIFQFRIGYAILAGLKLLNSGKADAHTLQKKANYTPEQSKSV